MFNFIIRRKLLRLLIVVIFVGTFKGTAQDSSIGNWLIYFGNKQFDEKWNLHHEVQYRNYDLIGDLEQLLLRTGLGYNLNANNNLLVGYGYILSENYSLDSEDKTSNNEHRIYQQYINKHNLGKWRLSHRFRFEQRFIENDFKMRIRYFLSFNIPLLTNPNTDKELYLSTYNELFLNTRKTIFDRNRLFAGLGYRFNKSLRIEAGYMNQFFNRGERDQLNLITFVNF